MLNQNRSVEPSELVGGRSEEFCVSCNSLLDASGMCPICTNLLYDRYGDTSSTGWLPFTGYPVEWGSSDSVNPPQRPASLLSTGRCRPALSLRGDLYAPTKFNAGLPRNQQSDIPEPHNNLQGRRNMCTHQPDGKEVSGNAAVPPGFKRMKQRVRAGARRLSSKKSHVSKKPKKANPKKTQAVQAAGIQRSSICPCGDDCRCGRDQDSTQLTGPLLKNISCIKQGWASCYRCHYLGPCTKTGHEYICELCCPNRGKIDSLGRGNYLI